MTQPDHPIREMKDMRTEIWGGRRNTRLVILISTLLAVICVILYILTRPVLPLQPAPVSDPIARGAENAFDVAPATQTPPPEPTPTTVDPENVYIPPATP